MRGVGDLITKDENSENWCFVCKDGGDLLMCDYEQCPKSYHFYCLRQPKSFLGSEKEWECDWHRCSVCHKSPYIHCYTCKNSVCRNCVSTEEILQVKGQYGFCKECLKLALLIEEKKDYDSEGGKVDFTDRETFEGLHMEYYRIVKEAEGFELADIYAAKERVKGKKRQRATSGANDVDEEEEEPISDNNDLELQKKKCQRSVQRSNGQNPVKQTSSKPNLCTLNPCKRQRETNADEKSGEENDVVKNVPLKSRFAPIVVERQGATSGAKDVDEEEEEPISDNDDLELQKKKCQRSLQSFNGQNPVKQTSAKPNLCTLNPCKRQRETNADEKSGEENDVVKNVPLKSRFASIVVENLKRVYLGRGVLKEMLKEADSFEEKVTGCFVRVKSSSYNHRSRSHQLVQVKGVKTVSIDENNTETVLLLSTTPNEIGIPLVSDEKITEEECENLRKNVLAGEIERPTVEYLQKKVNDVHKDMTNHSIRKEIQLLNHHIDHANEKGWRDYMFECLERKKRLQSPRVLARLLENVPMVIADVYEPDRDSKQTKKDVKGDGSSPESNNGGKTSGWHRCSVCRKSPYIHCYTCKNSVCRNCVSTEEILQVKGQHGFCKECLKLALLIEEKKDYDSDGSKVDFTDRETFEGLHMEYYRIVKEAEGFELADIYAAKERVKGNKNQRHTSGATDVDEEEEPLSDYDDLELQKKKCWISLKRSNGQNPVKQTPAILNEEDLCTLNPCKRQRKTNADENSGEENDLVKNVPLKSRFTSMVVENLKRVYLARGVLKEMLKEADSFEEKVTGCFVRLKSSSYNHRSRSHQLVQVKGVKTVSIDENNTETVLLLSAMPNEIGIPLVSDEEITEEECENLRKKVLDGEIERPTVEYLQKKVNDVHKDMTNHSIRKEIQLLNHRIDQANENGWRFYMFECLERRKTLQSPRELTRLLENVPTVIADIYEPGRGSKHTKNDVKGDVSSPESNNGGKTSEMPKKMRDSGDNNRQETSNKKRIKVTKPADPQATPQDDNTLQRVQKCLHCDETKTPQWRAGPMGPHTLCNACGVRYKSGRLFPEYRPSASPTFVPSQHSNSHRKVVEMRSKVQPGDAGPALEDPKVVSNA